jgi:hypothetical protein
LRRKPTTPAKLTIAPPGIQGERRGAAGRDPRSCALAARVEIVNVNCVGCPLAGVTEAELKAHVARLGSPPQAKLTALLNPPAGVTVRVNVADCPGVMVAEAGDAATEKPGATTVTCNGADTLPRLFGSQP